MVPEVSNSIAGQHLGTPSVSLQQTSVPKECSEDLNARIQEITAENLSVSLDKFDSPDLFRLIFSYMPVDDLGDCSLQWKELASGDPLREKIIVRMFAFGKEKWAKYFGDIGEEPPLPPNIAEILQSPCPYFSDKTVAQTHMLVLIPKAVNGNPFTLKSLTELMQNPKEGHKISFSYSFSEEVLKEHGDTQIKESYWVLMTKDPIPGSESRFYEEQNALIAGDLNYQMPSVLEAQTCILMDYFRTEKRHFSCAQSVTKTRCRELSEGRNINVGDFSDSSLTVSRGSGSVYYVGVSALRRV